MQVGEHPGRPAVREPAGAVGQVGGEQRADARPVRAQRHVPVAAERRGELRDAARRVGGERGDALGERAAPEQVAQLGTDLLRRRGRHPLELVLQRGHRLGRRRRDEVRDVALGRREREREREVEARGHGHRIAHPRQVQRGRLRVAQHAQARDELPHRRDREARAREVGEREFEDDHSAPAESIACGATPRRGSSDANPHRSTRSTPTPAAPSCASRPAAGAAPASASPAPSGEPLLRRVRRRR